MNSKAKGKRGELELVHILNEYGYATSRTAQYNGKAKDSEADLRGIDGLHIEAKWREKHNVYDYIDQTERDKKDGEIGCVFMKSNRKRVICLLTLEDFMKIWKGYEAKVRYEAEEKRVNEN